MMINVIVHRNLYPLTHFKEIIWLKGIITPSRYVIIKNHVLWQLNQFKKAVEMSSSSFGFQVIKNLNLINVIFRMKLSSLTNFENASYLNGIIIPETCLMLKTDINQHVFSNDFPFKMPFPARRPDSIPDYPEDPEEDPGDEPDDY